MLKFIVKRLLLGVVVMLGVITITFLLVHVLPSNPAAKWVGARATPEQIAQAEIELWKCQEMCSRETPKI